MVSLVSSDSALTIGHVFDSASALTSEFIASLGAGDTWLDSVSLRSNTELCVIAEVIKGQSTSVFHEDWMGLLSAAEIPPDFYEVVQAVRKNDSMHEKFWRYMNLFVFVISNTDDN